MLSFELRTDQKQLIDVTNAQILARGMHSLVLLPYPSCDFIVKISRSNLIDRERSIHNVVDGCSPYLRCVPNSVATTSSSSTISVGPTISSSYGIVNGAGNGLSFLCLSGVGTPFVSSHVDSDDSLSSYWDQAAHGLDAMHKKRILHRDVKPSNMIIIHGALLLNDFDISCELDSDNEIKLLEVGTEIYRSPKLDKKWRERDDWLSLALSFLSLTSTFSF